MIDEILAKGLAHPWALLPAVFTTTLAITFYHRWRASRLRLPFLKFEDGDDSRQRYVQESGKLLKLGYEKVSPPQKEDLMV